MVKNFLKKENSLSDPDWDLETFSDPDLEFDIRSGHGICFQIRI